MQTTTPALIIAHFEGLLRELEPAHEAHRDQRWARIVDAIDTEEATSHELRRYVFALGEPRLTREAFSFGEVYTFRIELHTACGGISSDLLVHLVDEDHLDLRKTFENELEPGTDGFRGIFRVDDLGFEMGSTLFDDAVVHAFDVAYFRETGLN
jgi:hypothetical protein